MRTNLQQLLFDRELHSTKSVGEKQKARVLLLEVLLSEYGVVRFSDAVKTGVSQAPFYGLLSKGISHFRA